MLSDKRRSRRDLRKGRVVLSACFPNDARIRSASVEINMCVEKLPWILVLVEERRKGELRSLDFLIGCSKTIFISLGIMHAIEQVGYMHAYC